MRYRRALSALGLAVGLAACDSTAASPQETVPPPPDPREQLLEDAGLRDVRMTSGEALRWVQPETASQILCQSLEKDAWEELLGGRVGRRAYIGPTATCHVAFSQGLVTVELSQSDDALDGDTTIAGRPAEIDVNGRYRVALTDEALEPAPRQYYAERRLLAVDVSADDADIESELAEKVIEELVPLLTEEGDPLPDIADDGTVRYEKTPLVGHFVDQPVPVQALQLCTLVRAELGSRVRGVEARDSGECRVDSDDNFTVAARHVLDLDEFPDRVADRPASRSSADAIRVLLRDDAGTMLYVTGEDAAEIAERLVPLLTG